MEASFLTPRQLAHRWNMTTGTLSQWRWSGRGSLYCKINGRVLYALRDVEEYENKNRRQGTSEDRRPSLEPSHPSSASSQTPQLHPSLLGPQSFQSPQALSEQENPLERPSLCQRR